MYWERRLDGQIIQFNNLTNLVIVVLQLVVLQLVLQLVEVETIITSLDKQQTTITQQRRRKNYPEAVMEST